MVLLSHNYQYTSGLEVVLKYKISGHIIYNILDLQSDNWIFFTKDQSLKFKSGHYRVSNFPVSIEFFDFPRPYDELKAALFPNGIDAIAKRIRECLK